MFKKAIVFVGSLFVMGCSNAEKISDVPLLNISEPSSVQLQYLSALQIQKLLLGHTYPLNQGGIYFSSLTKATLALDGAIEVTNWRATEQSSFCFMRSNKEICVSIKKSGDGNYIQEYNGITTTISANKIVKGKKRFNYFR